MYRWLENSNYRSLCRNWQTYTYTSHYSILANDDASKIKPATYPFVGIEMKMYQLNARHYKFNFEDIFEGAVPTQVVCGFVDS